MKMVPFLNNQKGYNCSTTHSVSLFVSTTTSSAWNRPYHFALDPSRPPLLVATDSRDRLLTLDRLLLEACIRRTSNTGLYLRYVCIWCMSVFNICPRLKRIQYVSAHPLFKSCCESFGGPSTCLPARSTLLLADPCPNFVPAPHSTLRPTFRQASSTAFEAHPIRFGPSPVQVLL